ncbi:MAG: ribonuclease D [Candidatus Puniceispirillaceae bacterium]|jgi:ribonuclease D
MAVYHYHDDLPDGLALGQSVAIDTETMGLKLTRDRLCLVQLSSGDGNAHLVQIAAQPNPAPNLKALLANPDIGKIFHFGRFDLAVLMREFGEINGHIYCTKIASKLARTYTDRHGLSELARELLNIDMSKQQQSSDWGRDTLSEAQLTYAASDVLYLHQIADRLAEMLARLDRTELAEACFAFLHHRVRLDLAGFDDVDIFHH